ncbi:two pore domain potassium channel family protein [Massilia sp. RP-1-19]|uniref:Two pore domain potassium channel family protein n=1 Tax=Massilia polaris TaxID=2728846 RepID=A0A848HHM7_9BURK|nr:two pore domain potassium channel family protein [Massilia polaris]NML59561.1 two pore domain potassium channel family protein [Massilia polaris]
MAPINLLHHTKRHPSAILLVVQLSGMLLYPVFEATGFGQTVFNAFGIMILSMTVLMVRRTPGHAWISATIALPVIVLLALQMLFDMHELLAWSSGLEALFYFYAAGSMVSYMMEDRRTTPDELFAAAATFTLLAWAFTHLFILLQTVQPGTFAAAVNASDARTWTELNYLSFALLSSTGIGDVIPLTSQARALASVEMLVGLMYLAAVVARLIGFSVSSHSKGEGGG